MTNILSQGAYRFVVDWENTGETADGQNWWDEARARTDTPRELIDLMTAEDSEAIVPLPRAEEVAAWCESIPGWDNGPEYAPHPLIIEDWH